MEGLKESNEDSANLKHFKNIIKAELSRRCLLDSLDVCSLPILAAAVYPMFKQLKFLKSEQISTVKAELQTRMLLSDAQDCGEKPPDGTKKHKSHQSTAFDILLLEKNLNSILPKGLLLVKPNHFIDGRTMPSAFPDRQ